MDLPRRMRGGEVVPCRKDQIGRSGQVTPMEAEAPGRCSSPLIFAMFRDRAFGVSLPTISGPFCASSFPRGY